MRPIWIAYLFFSMLTATLHSQSTEYQKNKMEKIVKGSVFTKIIKRELPAEVVFEDDNIIAFLPL